MTTLYERDDRWAGTPTDPPAPSLKAGDPCVFGQLPAICYVNSATDPQTSGVGVTAVLRGIFALEVVGKDHAGNAAIATGDVLYYVPSSGESPQPVTAAQLCKDATSGVRFGIALAPVASGATTKIPVRLGY